MEERLVECHQSTSLKIIVVMSQANMIWMNEDDHMQCVPIPLKKSKPLAKSSTTKQSCKLIHHT